MIYINILFYTITLVIFVQAAERPISVQANRCLRGSRLIGSSFMQQCMQEHGIEDYFSYYQELSQFPHVSDEIKIMRSMVMIPFFSTLHSKTKEDQKQVLDAFMQEKFVLNYSLWRLFLAALAHANLGDKGYILCTAIGNEDAALTRQLLKQGVDVNSSKYGYSSLWYCSTLHQAEELVAHGANVAHHHQHNDLIAPICDVQEFYEDKDGIALMDFYLRSGVQLNAHNNFGCRWVNILLQKLKLLDRRRYAVEAKLELLWNAGRSDATTIRAINKLLQKWDGYPIVRKLLHGGAVQRLQKRTLTGRHFTKIQPIAMKCASAKK